MKIRLDFIEMFKNIRNYSNFKTIFEKNVCLKEYELFF